MKSLVCPRCYTVISMGWMLNLPGGRCLYCAFDLDTYYAQLLETKGRCYRCKGLNDYLDAQIRELFNLG